MEISPSPLMLNIHLGAHTKRLMHGQLGLVLPSHDPIRLAEEIAIADHLLRGRLFVGMARGYQSRWMNILCQKLGVGATYSDGSEADRSNRLLFSENFKIMKKAWAEELLTWDGPTYKVPNPLSGIPDWPPAETVTATYGAPGEIGSDGHTVQGVSVVPKPYQTPHPPLFQAFGASPPTIEWCGANDVVPTILFGAVERIRELLEIYRAAHAAAGRDVAIGERVGVCRTFHIVEGIRGEDAVRAELLRRAERWEAPVWRGWYETFGLLDLMLRLPGEEGPVPAPGESIGERLLRSGVMIGGTVDDCKRQVERFLEVLPVDHLVADHRRAASPRAGGGQAVDVLHHRHAERRPGDDAARRGAPMLRPAAPPRRGGAGPSPPAAGGPPRRSRASPPGSCTSRTRCPPCRSARCARARRRSGPGCR
jgi:alkanesulfonate monooxygenase SsuD/methylene tetrahydromethanopterin reductase-like flavin-dependent oxidoreductase (luciferase family)